MRKTQSQNLERKSVVVSGSDVGSAARTVSPLKGQQVQALARHWEDGVHFDLAVAHLRDADAEKRRGCLVLRSHSQQGPDLGLKMRTQAAAVPPYLSSTYGHRWKWVAPDSPVPYFLLCQGWGRDLRPPPLAHSAATCGHPLGAWSCGLWWEGRGRPASLPPGELHGRVKQGTEARWSEMTPEASAGGGSGVLRQKGHVSV